MSIHLSQELAQKKFITWMKATHPALLLAAESKIKQFKPVAIKTAVNTSNDWMDNYKVKAPTRSTPILVDPYKKYQSPPFVPEPRYGINKPRLRKTYKTSLSGLNGWGDFFTDLTQNVVALAPQYVQYKQQSEMLKVQVARARQGLPPSTTGPQPVVTAPAQQYAPAPPAGPLSPPLVRENGGLKNMTPILIGVGVLAAVFLLKRKRR